MHKAKDDGRNAYIRCFKLPADQRTAACPYIQAVEAKQRLAGMNDTDIATAAQMLF